MHALNAEARSCREALRQTTDAAHRLLHEVPCFLALRAGHISREDYVAILLRLLGLHAPIEERLAALEQTPELAWHRTLPSHSRTARLRRDLAALGVASITIEAAPRADALLPVLQDAATGLGCAWVAEGSALGGRVLAANLNEDLGITRTAGAAFFTPLQSQAERWLACCAAVEACGASQHGLALMLSAAEATFAGFAAWMTEPSCL